MKKTLVAAFLAISLSVPVYAAEQDMEGYPNMESQKVETSVTENLHQEDKGTESMDTEGMDTESIDTESMDTDIADSEDSNSFLLETDSVKSEYLDTLMTTDNFEKMYQNIQSVMEQTNTNSLAEYYKENYEITIPEGDFFDMSDIDITTGYDDAITNAQYYALTTNFTKSYSGMVDASGKSGNSIKVFQQEYGDIADSLRLQTPSIPKNFNMSNLVSQSAASVQSTYKNALGNSGIAAVRDSIDTQWIFNKALKGPDSYSLASYKKLQSMNDAASSNNQSKQYKQYKSASNKNTESYKKLSADILTKSQSDLMKVIDTDSSYLLTTDPDKKQDIADDKREAATDVSGKLRRKTNWIKDFITNQKDELSDYYKDTYQKEFKENNPKSFKDTYKEQSDFEEKIGLKDY